MIDRASLISDLQRLLRTIEVDLLERSTCKVDPEFGMAMGDYFEGFITEEARNLDKTVDDIKAWQPPKKAARRRRKAKT